MLKKRNLLIAGGLTVVWLIAMGLYFVNRKPQVPVVYLPVPNGYDQFLKAAAAYQSDPKPLSDLSTNEIRLLLEKNKQTFELIESGLKMDCKVPLEFNDDSIRTNLSELAHLKGLALLLRARGKFFESEGQTNRAALVYCQGLSFSQESMRGGLVIHLFVRHALEGLVVGDLQRLFPSLDAEGKKEVSAYVQKVYRASEPGEVFLERDKVWSKMAIREMRASAVAKLVLLVKAEFGSGKVEKSIKAKIEKNLQSRKALLKAISAD